MSRRFYFWSALVVAVMFAWSVSAPASATYYPTQDEGQEQSQEQTAVGVGKSSAVAVGGSQGQTAEGGNALAEGSVATSGSLSGSHSGGNDFSFNDSGDTLALAVTSANAAPAVSGECLIHLRGFGIASAGSSGRTKIDEECVKFERCVAIADRLFEWGQPAAAIEQIRSCSEASFGEVSTVTFPLEHTHDESEYATIEALNRAFQESQEK